MRDRDPSESRGMVVVLIDRKAAIIDRLNDTELTRIATVEARLLAGHSDHMGDAPRLNFHSGTRGETIRDARAREREHMRQDIAARVTPLVADAASHDEWIVIGGNKEMVDLLHRTLSTPLQTRVVLASGVRRTSRADTIVSRAAAAVEARQSADGLTEVQRLLEATGAHTTGVTGPVATFDAVEHGAADVVLLTSSYVAKSPEEAQRLEAAVRAHGGRFAVVSSAAGQLLDEKAGGVGALLRFALHAMPRQGAGLAAAGP